MAQQYGLGRGLASLIPPKKTTDATGQSSFAHMTPVSQGAPQPVVPNKREDTSPEVVFFDTKPEKKATATESINVAVDTIIPNPHQPRLQFDEVKLDELAQSIKEHGVLQPLVVSPLPQSTSDVNKGGNLYEMIAGERRLQAAKRAGLQTVPVVVRDVTEQQKLELAIIENIQRHNLNPIEEAKAYLRLIDEFGMQQEAVAKKMSKSRSNVANTLRLLHLPVEIQRAVIEGKISEGHAKALLAIENPEKQRAVFDLIIKEELTVRETEVKVRSVSVKPHLRSTIQINPEILQRMEHLTQVFGTKVKINPSGKGGKIVIEYYSPEDLDGLLKRLEE